TARRHANRVVRSFITAANAENSGVAKLDPTTCRGCSSEKSDPRDCEYVGGAAAASSPPSSAIHRDSAMKEIARTARSTAGDQNESLPFPAAANTVVPAVTAAAAASVMESLYSITRRQSSAAS